MSSEETLELNLANKNSHSKTKNLFRNVDLVSKLKIIVTYFVLIGLIVSSILTVIVTAGKLGGSPLVADSHTPNLNNLAKLLESIQTVSAPIARFRPLSVTSINITEPLITDLAAWNRN